MRVKVDPVYRDITDAINGDINRYKDNRFDAAVTDLNAVIKDYNNLLAQRKGGAKNEEPK